MSNERYYPGLEGVIAGETAVSTVEGGLTYRGYTIEELAKHGSFLDVAYLLLHDDLPSQEELADFQSVLSESEEVEPSILEFLAHIPLHVPAMDVLRTGVSALAHFDPQLDDDGAEANRAKAIRMLAQDSRADRRPSPRLTRLAAGHSQPRAEFFGQLALHDYRQRAVART